MTETNQDITAFIAERGTPYDAATDTYRRAPFAEPIKAGKNTDIYSAHSYHTKVPPQGIVPYIEHYTAPGDLIMDPFCGSGMTGVAGLMCGRRVLLNDISPAAAHIARSFCTPIEPTSLRREFERIKATLHDELKWLYETTCARCSNPATIVYSVWSDVLECRRCGAELILWELAVDQEKKKVRSSFDCPECGASWRKAQLPWLRSVPVLTVYDCQNCRPKRFQHATTPQELQRIIEIEQSDIRYWYPDVPFLEGDWEMWRRVHHDQGIVDVSKFYTKRSLWAFAAIFDQIKNISDEGSKQALLFAFTGVVDKANKRNKYIPGKVSFPFPIQSGTLYIPSLIKEYSAWKAFEDKLLLRVIPTLQKLHFPHDSAAVTVVSATSLSHVPDETIDYIFTDPPFGSNIFYADCNLLWEAWLGYGFTDQSEEAVVHIKHKKKNTLPDYSRLMVGAFKEMHRVLKPGRWSSVVFHNSDDRIWQTILDAVEAAGFELAEVNAFDKEQLSFKGVRGNKGLERVTNKDLVLNLRKPAPEQQFVSTNTIYADEQERRVVEAIADFLDSNPPQEDRTLQGIWNHALDRMLRDGSVQVNMAAVGEMLPHYFKAVDGRWYLRGEAVFGGNVFDLNHDGGALAWLHSMLGNEPQTTGALIPRWQAATAHLGASDPGRLDRLLRENFWEDKRSGHWRIPTNEERTKMSARQSLADEAHLRTVRRYLDGKLDERVNDWKRYEWAHFCYKREAYAEALALAQQIDTARLDAEQAQALKKLIQVCRQRVAKPSSAG